MIYYFQMYKIKQQSLNMLHTLLVFTVTRLPLLRSLVAVNCRLFVVICVCGNTNPWGRPSDSLSNTNWQLTRHPLPEAQANHHYKAMTVTVQWGSWSQSAGAYYLPEFLRLPSVFWAGAQLASWFALCRPAMISPFRNIYAVVAVVIAINIRCPQVVPSATRTPPPPWKPINFYELWEFKLWTGDFDMAQSLGPRSVRVVRVEAVKLLKKCSLRVLGLTFVPRIHFSCL